MSFIKSVDIVSLLSLPKHLQETSIAMIKLGIATAEMVSETTQKARAVESSYLNQLVIMGIIKKEQKRKGRNVYFFVERKI